MFTQRIIVKMSFLCLQVSLKVYWFATISWFISLNRIFIWLFNDNKLKCILPNTILYIVKKRELCKTAPEGCCVTLKKQILFFFCIWKPSWNTPTVAGIAVGLIVGLVASSLAVIILVTVLIVCLVKRKRRAAAGAGTY